MLGPAYKPEIPFPGMGSNPLHLPQNVILFYTPPDKQQALAVP